jgi:hypothetical protein
VIAIGLILSAVFVPVGFMGGITGRLYQQFAITIALSVLLSVINALTLSPALAALLLRLLWQDYRVWALKPPTRDNAKRLADRAEEVSWVAAKGARLIMEPGRKGTGRLALDAAHAATLSQRVARLYLLRQWGVRDSSIDAQLKAASEDLQATVGKLSDATLNTPEIETELQVAEGQMGFLLQAAKELDGGRGSVRQMEHIAKAGDHMLEATERAVRLYEGLSP